MCPQAMEEEQTLTGQIPPPYNHIKLARRRNHNSKLLTATFAHPSSIRMSDGGIFRLFSANDRDVPPPRPRGLCIIRRLAGLPSLVLFPKILTNFRKSNKTSPTLPPPFPPQKQNSFPTVGSGGRRLFLTANDRDKPPLYAKSGWQIPFFDQNYDTKNDGGRA